MAYGNLLADVVQGSTANTPPVFKDGNGTTIGTLCRAWVNFNGTGTVAIRASFNVSSITDLGTGSYTINFTTAMTDANYAVSGTSGWNSASPKAALSPRETSFSTSNVIIDCFDMGATNNDSSQIGVAIFR